MRYRKLLSSLVMLGAFVYAGLGHSATVRFDTLLSGDPGQKNEDFAMLTFSPGATSSDPWTFKLWAYDLSGFGSSAFFGALAVEAEGNNVRVVETKPGGGIARVSYKNGRGPGGNFDFRFDLKGPKKDRLEDNEWVEWTVAGLSSISSLGAHIQGIGSNGNDSAWYGGDALPSPVPLPAPVWLVLTALLGFAGIKRWRKPRGEPSGLLQPQF